MMISVCASQVEYHKLKKEITAERAKAVDRMNDIQETAKNSLDKARLHACQTTELRRLPNH